jgi:hypothetical protein
MWAGSGFSAAAAGRLIGTSAQTANRLHKLKTGHRSARAYPQKRASSSVFAGK